MASRKKKRETRKRPAAGKKGKRVLSWIASAVILAGALTAAVLLYPTGQKSPSVASKDPESRQGKSGKLASQGSARAFRPLMGRWIRSDGGYIIEIVNIDASGKMDARYYNPRPIHVARAEAALVGGSVEVFLELKGEGYTGATYNLIYNAEKHLLAGLYYQPTEARNFSVVFMPMNQG